MIPNVSTSLCYFMGSFLFLSFSICPSWLGSFSDVILNLKIVFVRDHFQKLCFWFFNYILLIQYSVHGLLISKINVVGLPCFKDILISGYLGMMWNFFSISKNVMLRLTNIDGSFLLISCQDPNLDISFSQKINSLRDTLQEIFFILLV